MKIVNRKSLRGTGTLPFQHGRKKCLSCSCANFLIGFGFRGASYFCRCITHFGCCIKRKPRENIQVCGKVLPTGYQHITNCRPTVGRQSAYISGKTCWPSVGRQTADSRPTVGRQVFWGALLHNYPVFHEVRWFVLLWY